MIASFTRKRVRVSYGHEMDTGRTCMDHRDWTGAYRHFLAAHDLGHAVRSWHLGAHKAALRTALQARWPGRVLYQLIFMAVAFLTSWRHDAI